jgi:16S rRNA (guanine966-N2)-methyltransferase
MKVISGTIKGKSLRTLKGLDIRPTPNKVKEALFHMIREKISGARFLDLFAGSGSIGIEAVSREAGEVWFVDSDKRSVKLINENLGRCGIQSGYKVFCRDGIAFLRSLRTKSEKFDIVFLDPPYASGLGESSLGEISRADILEDDGLVVFEHFHKREVGERYGLLKRFRVKKFGDTCLSFFVKEGEEEG